MPSGAIAGGPNSFDGALKKWTQSLAATDPVLKAHIQAQKALQQQTEINTRAVQLGIATQDAAAAQLDKGAPEIPGLCRRRARSGERTAFGKGFGYLVEQAGPLIGILSAAAIIGFAKSTFENAAALEVEQAEQAGVNVEAFQAYRRS
jgi:hypothetical protein